MKRGNNKIINGSYKNLADIEIVIEKASFEVDFSDQRLRAMTFLAALIIIKVVLKAVSRGMA